jgi:hypothetical protein
MVLTPKCLSTVHIRLLLGEGGPTSRFWEQKPGVAPDPLINLVAQLISFSMASQQCSGGGLARGLSAILNRLAAAHGTKTTPHPGTPVSGTDFRKGARWGGEWVGVCGLR